MSHLAESVYQRQDGGVVIGWQPTSNKVQSRMEPELMEHRQWLQKSGGSLGGRFMLVADGPGIHKLPGVLLQGFPLDNFLCLQDPRVACKSEVVGPLNIRL